MEDMQRSLDGATVAVSEARIFDPANVQVANYDQLAVADFSKVQYLEITDSEAEDEGEGEDDENDENDEEEGEYAHTPAGDDKAPTAPTTALTPAQKRKKEKRKNKKAKAEGTYTDKLTYLPYDHH